MGYLAESPELIPGSVKQPQTNSHLAKNKFGKNVSIHSCVSWVEIGAMSTSQVVTKPASGASRWVKFQILIGDLKLIADHTAYQIPLCIQVIPAINKGWTTTVLVF